MRIVPYAYNASSVPFVNNTVRVLRKFRSVSESYLARVRVNFSCVFTRTRAKYDSETERNLRSTRTVLFTNGTELALYAYGTILIRTTNDYLLHRSTTVVRKRNGNFFLTPTVHWIVPFPGTTQAPFRL